MDAIKRYRLVIGAIAVLAMVGLAIWAIRNESGDTAVVEADTPELPEIERDAITEVEIRRPNEEAIRLVKSGETWRLAAPIEALAAQTSVDTLLDKLADLEVAGVASAHARFHERFEVDEAHGVHVIARAGTEELINFWIGGARGGNSMLRLDGQEQTLLVEGQIKFAFNKPAQDFRDRAIVELEADDLREATFTNTNGSFHFRKNGEAWEQVLEPAAEGAEPPAAIERFAPTKVGTTVSGLARLRASSFGAADVSAQSAGLGEDAPRVVLVSGEGESAATVTLRVGNEVDAGSRYVMREGNDTIFVVSSFMATRLLPNAEAFQEAEPGAEPAEPAEPPPGMPGMPPGGGGQIPPELMQQIQRQLQQQQGGHGGH